jgi:hypothetical protein
MTIFTAATNMFRRIQNFLFDPEDNPACRPRRTCIALTPEQRARRKKLRERLLRRQLWIIPDAKPLKKRKKIRRRRRRADCRLPRQPQAPRLKPDRVLKRQYKPLASPIFNLPAGLIDCMEKNKLNLKMRKHRQAAHKIADMVAAVEIKHGNMDADEVEAMHAAIEQLAKNPKPIPEQLAEIRDEFERLSAEVRDGIIDPETGEKTEDGWSQHHRDKVNNYYRPPMEVARVCDREDGTVRTKETSE